MEQQDKDFFNKHSSNFLAMALAYEKDKKDEEYNCFGEKTGDCGDTVKFYLIIEDSIIKHIYFEVFGCLNTRACANTISTFAEGKSIEEAWKVTPEGIIAFLETLPYDHHHCAELSCGAFYRALNSYKFSKL